MRSARLIPLQGEQYIESLLTHRYRYTALDWVWAGQDEKHPAPGHTAEQAALTQGLLRFAGMKVISLLFYDISLLTSDQYDTDLEDLEVLRRMPTLPRSLDKLQFAYRLMATAMSVSERLTVCWSTLSCTAEELMLSLILDETDLLNDLHEVDLDADWRSRLTDALFEDTDFETYLDHDMPTDIDIWAPFRPGDIEVHPYQEFNR